jgi:hypothetical protein
MQEVWKPIDGYDGLYEVSSSGSVRSLDRAIKRKDGVVVSIKGRTLAQRLTKDGYLQVQLSIKNKAWTPKIHRLVAETFIPNPDGLPEVNHKNEDKTDNSVINLEWCTHRYNSGYGTRGERIARKNSKQLIALSPSKDRELVFSSMSEAAKYFGVSGETVRQSLKYGWKCRGYTLKAR